LSSASFEAENRIHPSARCASREASNGPGGGPSRIHDQVVIQSAFRRMMGQTEIMSRSGMPTTMHAIVRGIRSLSVPAAGRSDEALASARGQLQSRHRRVPKPRRQSYRRFEPRRGSSEEPRKGRGSPGSIPTRGVEFLCSIRRSEILLGFPARSGCLLSRLVRFFWVLPPCLRDRSPDEGAPPSLSHCEMPLLGLPLGRLGRVFVVMGM
jgi:hypothetical protein